MEKITRNHIESRKPSMTSALVFLTKAALLQLNRAAHNLLDGNCVRFPIGDKLSNQPVIAELTLPLWSSNSDSEQHLLAGKVHNLRLAIRQLNGAEVPARKVFSFWAQIGRASRWKGFAKGRELREGCLIPTTGGGLCQLSGSLYDTALRAGFEIIERHAHTEVVPGSLAESGRDATVFWNYVDLRFRSTHAFRIEASMSADSLTIRIRGRANNSQKLMPVIMKKAQITHAGNAPQSCASCDVQNCFRHEGQSIGRDAFGRSACIVDEYWPEFDDYLCVTKQDEDLLLIPINGKGFAKPNYGWSAHRFRHVKQRLMLTLLRSYQSRKLAMQGAARQRALLAFDERLASGYASLLSYDVTHVTVTQSLLPFLWRDGHLGGRTFDVLMTRLPIFKLHERLDWASRLHPESNTLSDFRADDWLVQAELEALRAARKIISPHSDIASLYRDKAITIDWILPPRRISAGGRATDKIKIVFPAPTAGRKGAYELRAALRGLNVQLVTTATKLEGKDFWHGLSVEERREDWLEGASVVVLPAFVEHKPRRLLEAVARGIPVIATTACGLENTCGVINIPTGDVIALRNEIERICRVHSLIT